MTFAEIVNGPVTELGDLVIMLLYAIAFALFLFGMMKFFFAGGEDERAKGKQHMLWGIIALGVLFAVWGLVKILLGLLTSWA